MTFTRHADGRVASLQVASPAWRGNADVGAIGTSHEPPASIRPGLGVLACAYRGPDRRQRSRPLTAALCTIDSVDGTPDKLRFVDCSTLTTSSATNLTLAPTGDLGLGLAGVDVPPNTGYTVNPGALEQVSGAACHGTVGGNAGGPEHSGNHRRPVLVAPTTSLYGGHRDRRHVDRRKHNNPPTGTASPEANGAVEFMAITSSASGSGAPYTYTVTRNLDGSGANAWHCGRCRAEHGQ